MTNKYFGKCVVGATSLTFPLFSPAPGHIVTTGCCVAEGVHKHRSYPAGCLPGRINPSRTRPWRHAGGIASQLGSN